MKTVRQMREMNISVRVERENINSLLPDGELMLSILASYAQEESFSNIENVKWKLFCTSTNFRILLPKRSLLCKI